MPAFAHWFFSIGLAIFLWKVTEGKFGIKPAFVYIVNNAYGPDIMGAFLSYDNPVYLFFHGIGWYLLAGLWAVLWFYLMNGIIEKHRTGPSIFSRIHLLEKENRIKYWQIYLFTAAGGMTHSLVDLIGHPSFIDAGTIGTNVPWGVVWFGDNAYMSLNWVQSTGLFPCGGVFPAVIAITIGYATGIILSLYWGMRTRSFWNFAKGLLLVIAIMFVIYLITYFIPLPDGDAFFTSLYGTYTYYGDTSNIPLLVYITGGESDFGTTVFLGLFFFIPLILLYYGFKDLPKSTFDPALAGDQKEKGARKASAPYLE